MVRPSRSGGLFLRAVYLFGFTRVRFLAFLSFYAAKKGTFVHVFECAHRTTDIMIVDIVVVIIGERFVVLKVDIQGFASHVNLAGEK